MDNREDAPLDPVSHQLAAIQIRLSGLETAIALRNARHGNRAGRTIQMLFAFGFGLVVGSAVVGLVCSGHDNPPAPAPSAPPAQDD